MVFLVKDEVIEIHRRLIEQFGGADGIRDEGLLDSALSAAPNRQHYESADLSSCAATYAYHPTRNHPFVDGNKRAGAAAAEVFVRLNGAHFTASNDAIVELMFGIADESLAREDVEAEFIRWVRTSS